MPVDYTGSAAAIAAHQAATIPTHLDTDAPEAALDNAPLKKLADLLAFLQQYAPIMGAGVANEGPLEIAGNLAIGGVATVTGSVKSGAPVGATDLKLVSEHPGFGTGAGSVRRYAVGNSTTLALVEVVNAYWGVGSAWVREFADQPAYLIRLSQAGLRVMAWPVGDATPFARELRLFEAGMKWTGTGTGAADANPPAATALANTLVAKNVCKAWGSIKINVDNTLTLLDGFNVASLAASGNDIVVTFASPMADANYSVGYSYDGSRGSETEQSLLSAKEKAAGSFKLAIKMAVTGNAATFNGQPGYLDFQVFGKQTT